MAKPKAQNYRLLPEWAISQAGTSLLISGGADARYSIELEGNETSYFALLKSTQTFKRNDLGPRDQRVLEELVTAEVVVPVLQQGKALRITIVGDVNQLQLSTQKDSKTADLVVVVRTTSTYAELLAAINYPGLTKPHLFVDMAFHHTLSVGPLVFPGETACIACLQGRIGMRWGDEKPPANPTVANKYSGLTTELVKTELDKIAGGDTSLTNKTASWNFKDRAVRTDQLLKVPLCPICTQNKVDHTGALALPWGQS